MIPIQTYMSAGGTQEASQQYQEEKRLHRVTCTCPNYKEEGGRDNDLWGNTHTHTFFMCEDI